MAFLLTMAAVRLFTNRLRPKIRDGQRFFIINSIGWITALLVFPILAEYKVAHHMTLILILANTSLVILGFVFRKASSYALSGTLVVLFAFLSYQIYSAFGPHHYQFSSSNPAFSDWVGFNLAHILRVTDLIDFLDEYDIKLQSIRHNSIWAGTVLVGLHLSFALFLGTLIQQYLYALLYFITNGWTVLADDHGKWFYIALVSGLSFILFPFLSILAPAVAILVLLLMMGIMHLLQFLVDFQFELETEDPTFTDALIMTAFTLVPYVVLCLILAYWSSWSAMDWFLWPLDNYLRTVDIADTFQIYDWQLHSVEMDGFTRVIAILLRFLAGISSAYLILSFWSVIGAEREDE